MRQTLAGVVARLIDARERRAVGVDDRQPWLARFDAVLAALRVDYPIPPDPGPAGPLPHSDRLARLGTVFGLDSAELDLLAVAGAADLDVNIAMAFGLLQGVQGAGRATAALAHELCGVSMLSAPGRARLGPGSPLRRHGLLDVVGDEPWHVRALVVRDRVVAHLLGDDEPEPALAALVVEAAPVDAPEVGPLAAALGAGTLCWVRAPLGTAGLGLAASAYAAMGLTWLAVDLGRRPPQVALPDVLVDVVREAGLRAAGLIVVGAEVLTEPGTRPLLDQLEAARVPVVAVANRGWDPAWLPRVPCLVDAPRHRRPTTAKASVAHAPATFDDLVLPELPRAALHELVGWARHRDEVLAQGPLQGKGGKGTGITALFTGSPGTGKTLAAHVVSEALGLDLLPVDLTTIVDKYIGETEKNLERVFHEAEALNRVLFFDEADSLFGSRSDVRDSRDRYANLEVSYLLQRMERFEGISILATNLRGNLDPAFSRRLHFIVHFPDPDASTRARLWHQHLSFLAGTDPADPVDVEHLAQVGELSGGDIRNVVLAAAYAAAIEGDKVGMRHVVTATVREYRKLGRRLPDLASRPPTVPQKPAAAVQAAPSQPLEAS